MAIVAILVFGAALALSVWAIWATISPSAARIVDLLTYGPVTIPSLPMPVPARSSLRNVRVLSVTAPAQRRVAA